MDIPIFLDMIMDIMDIIVDIIVDISILASQFFWESLFWCPAWSSERDVLKLRSTPLRRLQRLGLVGIPRNEVGIPDGKLLFLNGVPTKSHPK